MLERLYYHLEHQFWRFTSAIEFYLQDTYTGRILENFWALVDQLWYFVLIGAAFSTLAWRFLPKTEVRAVLARRAHGSIFLASLVGLLSPMCTFAAIPVVQGIDAFTDMKEKGVVRRRPDRYEDIHMPKNTASGLVNGALAAVFGFAMVWHIWWLAGVGAAGMTVALILRAADEDTAYTIPAAEVSRIEALRDEQLAAAA